ncbi:hypothetical protein NQ314_006503 [Rhamnusium bicolor]|uniref:Uncharacterized protein n=1 Tax=Rhamnusium bicolor TaxID=1586634 RepID=A0AAV8Z0W0_9CUCU|nr:hypothetical protein NQ314_006503 [Rhamnusium bicolor]
MSQICDDCPANSSNCNNLYCTSAEGSTRGTIIANRQLPGPSIQVCQNDILVVDIINKIPGHSLTVHWRGQPNHEAPFMDGVPMVTQCPISGYTTFQYKFRASSPGTHFYHAHSDADRTDGFFGALIVRQANKVEPHGKLYDVDSKEHIVLLSEWSGDLSTGIVNEDDLTKAIMINGKSPEVSGHSLSVFNVEKDKRYRFRVAYTAGSVGCPVAISVDSHLLKIIALDGNPINPYEVSSAELTKGERLDFVLKTNQKIGAYFLRAKSTCNENELNGLSMISYDGFSGANIENKIVLEENFRKFDTSLCNSKIGKVCLGDVRSLNKIPSNLRKFEPAYFCINMYHDNVCYFSGSLKDVRSKIYRINNFTFTYPPSPLLTQPNDVPLNLMCNELNTPDKCVGQSVCECVHLEYIALGTTTEIILIDQGMYMQNSVYCLFQVGSFERISLLYKHQVPENY